MRDRGVEGCLPLQHRGARSCAAPVQLGFNLTPFESGLITLSSVVGAMGMKTVVPLILGRFGFRAVLVVNAFISAAMVGLCATFTPGVPFAWIVGMLVVGGFFRSLQFTSLNIIAYADVDNRRMSRATSLVRSASSVDFSRLAMERSPSISRCGLTDAPRSPQRPTSSRLSSRSH